MRAINFRKIALFFHCMRRLNPLKSLSAIGLLCLSGFMNKNDLLGPTVTTLVSAAYCGNNDGWITATGAGGTAPYTFSIDGIHFQSYQTFFTLAPGTYTITMKDSGGSEASTTVTVGSNCMRVTETFNITTCGQANGYIQAMVTGGMPPYTYSIGGAYQASPLFTNVVAGMYTLTVMDQAGNTRFQQLILSNEPGPTMTVSEHPVDCSGQGGLLTINASSSYLPLTYSDDGTHFGPGNVFTASLGNYTLYVKDANGCVTTQSVTVTTTCFQLTLTVANKGCGQNSGEIDVTAAGGTPGYRYSVDNGTTWQKSPQFSGLAPGNYTILGQDAAGASASASASVVAIPLLSITVQPKAATCSNDDGVIDIGAAGGTPPYQYSIDQGSAASVSDFTGLATGDHTAMIVDTRGCTRQTTAVVPLLNTVTATVASPAPVCEGGQVLLAAVSNGAHFSWSPANGLNDPNVLTPQASPAVTTEYTLAATTGVCQQTANVTVSIYPAPVADAGIGDTLCYGASAQLHASGGAVYYWSPAIYLSDPNASDPTVESPLQTTTYSLTVTDALGCTSLQSSAVVVAVTPPAAVSIGIDTSILAGQPVPMDLQDINGSGFDSFSWSPATWLSDATIRDPVASPQQDVTYTVSASTAAGCRAEAKRTVTVYSVAGIFVPNAFTPNGDGHNDVLHARPVGIRTFKYFAVFSRWGQRVFYNTDPAVGWDGRIGGQYGLAATYVWMAAGIDYSGALVERKGTVMVVR